MYFVIDNPKSYDHINKMRIGQKITAELELK